MNNFQEEMGEEPNVLKIIIAGDSHVGKSSLITRFFDKKFVENNPPTVGLDFRIMKKVKLKTGKEYQVSIWDTAGQEQFRSIVKFFCKGSDGALICFDLNDPKSIESVPEWVTQVQQNCNKDVAIAVVGTKKDKTQNINSQTIENMLHKVKLDKYFLTSAKTQEGVEEMFNYLFNEAAKNKKENEFVLEIDRKMSNNKVSHFNLFLTQTYKLSSLKQTQVEEQKPVGKKQLEKKSGCC